MYYKFYNKDGKKCYIKFTKNVNINNPIIKFKRPFDENWLFHIPNKKFKNCIEIIHFIINNLETNKTKFKVV